MFIRGPNKPRRAFLYADKAMPFTVAEVLEHPAYPHVIWDLQPTKKGKVAVANGRGGPFDIAFEVHGSGPNHLVVRQL